MWKFRKLTPAIVLVAVVAILAAAVIVAVYGERSYTEQKVTEVSVQARILASTVTAALTFDDRRAAQEYVNALEASRAYEASVTTLNAAKGMAMKALEIGR